MIKNQDEIIDDYKWELSRKEFIRSILAISVISQVSFLTACETETESRNFDCAPLSKEQLLVLQAIQLVLFPTEGSGPSALEINADKWIVYVLNDEREPQREKDFIITYIDKLNDSAKEKYQKSFDSLFKDEKEDLIHLFFEDSKQKRWGSRMLTLIFEALLLDPIYGVNTSNIGWKWLNHNPGIPRPTEKTKYPTFYTTINEV